MQPVLEKCNSRRSKASAERNSKGATPSGDPPRTHPREARCNEGAGKDTQKRRDEGVLGEEERKELGVQHTPKKVVHFGLLLNP